MAAHTSSMLHEGGRHEAVLASRSWPSRYRHVFPDQSTNFDHWPACKSSWYFFEGPYERKLMNWEWASYRFFCHRVFWINKSTRTPPWLNAELPSLWATTTPFMLRNWIFKIIALLFLNRKSNLTNLFKWNTTELNKSYWQISPQNGGLCKVPISWTVEEAES